MTKIRSYSTKEQYYFIKYQYLFNNLLNKTTIQLNYRTFQFIFVP